MVKRGKSMSEKLSPIGRLIRLCGAARFYHNGDGAGFVWRWWHPLSWVGAPLLLLLLCVTEGAPSAWRWRQDVGLRLEPWFVLHPEKLEWES